MVARPRILLSSWARSWSSSESWRLRDNSYSGSFPRAGGRAGAIARKARKKRQRKRKTKRMKECSASAVSKPPFLRCTACSYTRSLCTNETLPGRRETPVGASCAQLCALYIVVCTFVHNIDCFYAGSLRQGTTRARHDNHN